MSEENTSPSKTPTLYEWAGGKKAFNHLISKFYDKVLADDVLKPVFRHMSKEHQSHVAHFIMEVLGGPKMYTESGGSHFGMVKKHFGKHLNERHRKQFVKLLIETADEVGLPDDPEFRSAFVGYLEWGTRLAVINSNEDEIAMNPDEPMPKWGWGEVGGPYIED
ncbi:MAG: group II truncated hemoglobin [Aurantibacter sp.]